MSSSYSAFSGSNVMRKKNKKNCFERGGRIQELGVTSVTCFKICHGLVVKSLGLDYIPCPVYIYILKGFIRSVFQMYLHT